MAIKTLENAISIGGFAVINMDDLATQYPEHFNKESGQMNWEWFEREVRPKNFIYIRPEKNSLTFTIQNGPIKEKGLNGCQVVTIMQTALHMLKELNRDFPSIHNENSISALENSIHWQEERTRDRKDRGVEGRSLL